MSRGGFAYKELKLNQLLVDKIDWIKIWLVGQEVEEKSITGTLI